MARRRLLITGAGGLLGSELADVCLGEPWRDRYEALARPHAALDVTDPAAVSAALDADRPDVVVDCAGYTRVDDAEREPEEAYRLNAEAPGRLAAACADRGIRLVYVSTDYVFDGRKGSPYLETDPTGPLQVYGRSKLAGERAVAAAFGDGSPGAGGWLVVRTQWLYGRVGRSFVKALLARAGRGEPLRVVDDQRGAPTRACDLAEAILALLAAGASGTVHVTNSGEASRFDVARAVLDARGLLSRVPLDPVPTAAVATPAARPAHAVLDGQRYRSLARRTMRPWCEALRAFLAQELTGV